MSLMKKKNHKMITLALIIAMILANASIVFANDHAEKILYSNPSLLTSDEAIMENAEEVDMDADELAQYSDGMLSKNEFLYTGGILYSVESINKKMLRQLVQKKEQINSSLAEVSKKSNRKIIDTYNEDSLVTINIAELEVPEDDRIYYEEGMTYSLDSIPISSITYDKSYSGIVIRNTTQFNESYTSEDGAGSIPTFALINAWGKVLQIPSKWTAKKMYIKAAQYGNTYDVDGFPLGVDSISKSYTKYNPITNQAYKLAVGAGNIYYESLPDLGTATYTKVRVNISNGFVVESKITLSSV